MPGDAIEKVTIRLATREDASTIIPLVNAAFTVEDFIEGTRTDTERMVNAMESGQFLVAEDSVGKMLAAVYVELRGDRGYFGMLAVDPAMQGRGLGRKMIEAAEDHCRNVGCRYMDIRVLSARQGLPSYYRQFGYEVTGKEEFRPSRPLKAGVECYGIVMTKKL
jgi:ribosomal protein S18 acetylase RimI-like enzyme